MPRITGLENDIRNAYLSMIGREYKRDYEALKQLNLKIARAELSNEIVSAFESKKMIKMTPMYLGKNPLIKNIDSNGYIIFNIKGVGKRLQEAINKENEKFIKEVFDLSQEYVPIDKKYADATNVEFVNTGRKKVKFDVFSSDRKTFEDYFTTTDRETRLYCMIRKNRQYTFFDRSNTFERTSGYYEKSEADFIREMFRGKARNKKYSDIYFNPETGTMWKRKDQYYKETFDTGFKLTNNPFSTSQLTKMKLTTRQPTGGFKELKNGGRIETRYKEKYIIYSAYDKTRDGTFNYAKLQHDNMKFKHYRGKKALFLYRAFSERRKEWLANVKKTVAESMVKGV